MSRGEIANTDIKPLFAEIEQGRAESLTQIHLRNNAEHTISVTQSNSVMMYGTDILLTKS